jgi:hypothetical protein
MIVNGRSSSVVSIRYISKIRYRNKNLFGKDIIYGQTKNSMNMLTANEVYFPIVIKEEIYCVYYLIGYPKTVPNTSKPKQLDKSTISTYTPPQFHHHLPNIIILTLIYSK